MSGLAGHILVLDLDRHEHRVVATTAYSQWGGGHALGTALFWHLVDNPAISGFSPRNVVTIATSPLTGTAAGGAGARCEIQGIGVHSSPVEWFTRSNLGGRFGAMLKYAGWDAVAIVGASSEPVWVDIRDQQVRFRSAEGLWGEDTWRTQQLVWEDVVGVDDFHAWHELDPESKARTSQRPAVLCIGPAGENKTRVAALIHDAGNAAGQGGFGGVWGAKGLKAISVIGSGSVPIADPQALLEARAWAQREYAHPIHEGAEVPSFPPSPVGFGLPVHQGVLWKPQDGKRRPVACVGCHAGCRGHVDTGVGNDSTCMESAFYAPYDLRKHSSKILKRIAARAKKKNPIMEDGLLLAFGRMKAGYQAADSCQKLGINAAELFIGLPWIQSLVARGVLGPGAAIHTDLPVEDFGGGAFIEAYMHAIATRTDIGEALAEGCFRAAAAWGRQEHDLSDGSLRYAYWGLPEHGYDPRAEVEWGYGSVLGDRDINEHGFNVLFWYPTVATYLGQEPAISAEQAVGIVAGKIDGDPDWLDFSESGIYSDGMARLVSWHRHYSRFWKQSMLFCDWKFPDFLSWHRPDATGSTPEAEPRYVRAVTGSELSFADGVNLGRKVWNIDNAIWTLQGRHRDMVRFAPYIYTQPFAGTGPTSLYIMPGRRDGQWEWMPVHGRFLDEERFEDWKTRFYEIEGWDPATGHPTRATLHELGLDHLVERLIQAGKLEDDGPAPEDVSDEVSPG